MLREDDKAPHFIKVNWDKSVDEDKDKCGKYFGCGRNGLLRNLVAWKTWETMKWVTLMIVMMKSLKYMVDK